MDGFAQIVANQGVSGIIMAWMLYMLWDAKKDIQYWRAKYDALRSWVDTHLVEDINAERGVRDKTNV